MAPRPAARRRPPFGPTALVIDGKNLTIAGTAAPGLVISGNNQRRIFAITGGPDAGGKATGVPAPGATPCTLTLLNLTLTDGLATVPSNGLAGAGSGSGGG